MFLTFWLRNVLRATTACTFSTSELPKVARTFGALNIFTSKCASRHNGVHFFDISPAKSGPHLVCFAHFDLQMCFAPQRRALFPHLTCQKWSAPGVFCTFWLANVLRATTACNFSSLIWPAGSAPAALASLLFDPPELQIIGKTQCFATFLPFLHLHLLSSYSFSSTLLSSNLSLLSASSLLCFSSSILSEVWLLNFLRWWFDLRIDPLSMTELPLDHSISLKDNLTTREQALYKSFIDEIYSQLAKPCVTASKEMIYIRADESTVQNSRHVVLLARTASTRTSLVRPGDISSNHHGTNRSASQGRIAFKGEASGTFARYHRTSWETVAKILVENCIRPASWSRNEQNIPNQFPCYGFFGYSTEINDPNDAHDDHFHLFLISNAHGSWGVQKSHGEDPQKNHHGCEAIRGSWLIQEWLGWWYRGYNHQLIHTNPYHYPY